MSELVTAPVRVVGPMVARGLSLSRAPAVPPTLGNLVDRFEGNALAPIWNDGQGVTVVSGGFAALPYKGSTGDPYNYLGSTVRRVGVGQTIYMEVSFPTAAAAGAQQFLYLSDGANEILFGRLETSIGYIVGAESGFAAWSDVNHRWWRMRVTATHLVFETSADGLTWADPFAGDNMVPIPFSLNSLRVRFNNGAFSGAGAGDMRIHNINSR